MSTYTPIASQTLSSNASSVTFNGIPQTYTDLVLVIWSKPYTNSEGSLKLTYNSDTGSNYSNTGLFGDGSSPATSGRNSNSTSIAISSGNALNNPRQPMFIIQIMNYSNTTTYKTSLTRTSEGSSSAGYVDSWVGLWRNTAAITSLTIGVTYIFDIGAGSTFNLYGINAANSSQAKATGGDSIYRDASYWYHVFNKSGTFTPAQNLSNVDYLVVAGGGGGGKGDSGGGGGAGGLRCTVTATGGGGSLESALSLVAQAYTVTVGAGGAGATGAARGTSGSDSVFATITSTGGGGGGAQGVSIAGLSGGSGGGGTYLSGAGGAGTANQGYAGGTHTGGVHGGSSGGGGAGAVGTAGGNSNTLAGAGGNGVATSISGSSVTYAGGGGGGINNPSATQAAGGTGGGGMGSTEDAGENATSGTANLGAGGGGGGPTKVAGAGGSGIIIVRYPV